MNQEDREAIERINRRLVRLFVDFIGKHGPLPEEYLASRMTNFSDELIEVVNAVNEEARNPDVTKHYRTVDYLLGTKTQDAWDRVESMMEQGYIFHTGQIRFLQNCVDTGDRSSSVAAALLEKNRQQAVPRCAKWLLDYLSKAITPEGAEHIRKNYDAHYGPSLDRMALVLGEDHPAIEAARNQTQLIFDFQTELELLQEQERQHNLGIIESAPIEIAHIRARIAVLQADTRLIQEKNLAEVRRELSKLQTATELKRIKDRAALERMELEVEARRNRAENTRQQALAGLREVEAQGWVEYARMRAAALSEATVVVAQIENIVDARAAEALRDKLITKQAVRTAKHQDRRQMHAANMGRYVAAAGTATLSILVSNLVADNPTAHRYNNPVFRAINDGWDAVYEPIVGADAGVKMGIDPSTVVLPPAGRLTPEERSGYASYPINGEQLTFECIERQAAPSMVRQPQNVQAANRLRLTFCNTPEGETGLLADPLTGLEYRIVGM